MLTKCLSPVHAVSIPQSKWQPWLAAPAAHNWSLDTSSLWKCLCKHCAGIPRKRRWLSLMAQQSIPREVFSVAQTCQRNCGLLKRDPNSSVLRMQAHRFSKRLFYCPHNLSSIPLAVAFDMEVLECFDGPGIQILLGQAMKVGSHLQHMAVSSGTAPSHNLYSL